MNNSIFLGFGDSWTYGDELDPKFEVPYIGLVAQHYNSEYLNYSDPGTGIPHLVLQLKTFLNSQYLDKNTYCAIFFLSAQERFLTYQNGVAEHLNPRGIFPTGNNADILKQTNTLYYKHLYSADFANYMTNVLLITLQSICQRYNINDYYIPGWQNFNFWPEVNRQKIYQRSCVDILNQAGHNQLFLAEGGHPNQAGHQIIANALIEWIKNS